MPEPHVPNTSASLTDAEPATRHRFRYTLPGAYGAMAFAVLSFAPSLLPRGGLLQGAITGITAAIGYGLGVTVAWVWRAFADRDARGPKRSSWLIFTALAISLILLAYLASFRWQGRIRDLMGVEPPAWWNHLVLPIIAAGLFVGLVALGRALHHLYLWLAALLHRWIGPKAARIVGWTIVVGGTYLVVSGVLFNGFVNLANQSFSVANGNDKPGVVETTSPLRSGGPVSLVPWDSLGREGRAFVATGPSDQQISDWSGQPASDPIRAFAGLDTASDPEERADLAANDLERMGGFDRKYLLIVTTTGSGWISPGAADSFEYLTNGDSAIVGMQYSYLPSWISYLVDQAKAREAGRDLFDAVYEKWLEQPPNNRPELYVFGESLGTFGAEAAFSGERDLANRTDGALFTGPPNFNPLHVEFTQNRDPGTSELLPTYKQGRIVRFTNAAGQSIPPADQPWDGPHVLYVQHPSDPIVWWSPDLLFHKTDWMDEPPGDDVLDLTWIPIVTFWQISADLPYSTGVPPGHGHVYTPSYVEGWTTVLQITDLPASKGVALDQIVATSMD